MNPDVVFALTGDIRYNSRALKQLEILSEHGYAVAALGIGRASGEAQLFERVVCHTLPRPAGSGPLFFRRVHQLFVDQLSKYSAGVYHASDLYTLPAQRRAAARHGGRLIYDARERYPYVASTARRPWVSWFWEAVERRHIRHADAVFTVSKSIASHLVASYGIDYPAVLYNVPAMRRVERSNRLRQRLGLPDEVALVLHQGKMQKDRGCRLLLQSMRHVNGAVLVFLGDGPIRSRLEKEVVSLGLEGHVFFLDPVPPAELLETTASANIGVTLLEDTCLNHRYALPNKLFEYLMAGLPVLGSALPEIENVVTGYDVGRVVPPAGEHEIASALQAMIDDPQARADWSRNTSRVFETFSWEKASELFVRIYRELHPGDAA